MPDVHMGGLQPSHHYDHIGQDRAQSVGVDIGCGMETVRLREKRIEMSSWIS